MNHNHNRLKMSRMSLLCGFYDFELGINQMSKKNDNVRSVRAQSYLTKSINVYIINCVELCDYSNVYLIFNVP